MLLSVCGIWGSLNWWFSSQSAFAAGNQELQPTTHGGCNLMKMNIEKVEGQGIPMVESRLIRLTETNGHSWGVQINYHHQFYLSWCVVYLQKWVA